MGRLAAFLRLTALGFTLAGAAVADPFVWELYELTLEELNNGITGSHNQFNARITGDPSGDGLYLGKGDLSVPGNRVGKPANWVSGTAKAFSFSYDLTGGGRVKANLGDGAELTRAQPGLPESIEFVYISLLAGAGQTIEVKNLAIGGYGIADLPTYTGGFGARYFKLRSNAFTATSLGLTGNLTFHFDGNGTDYPQIELFAAPSVPEPGFYGLLAAGLGGLFFIRQRRRRQP